MKARRAFITAILVIGIVGLALPLTPATGQDAAKLQQAELTMLRSALKSRADEIAQLKAENAKLAEQVKRLVELCAKAGVATDQPTTAPAAMPPEAPKAETYMYLGKPRPKVWFDQMYEKFADKILRVDGKYTDIGAGLLVPQRDYKVEAAAMGTVGTVVDVMAVPVTQVLDSNSLFLQVESSRFHDARRFHVKGVDTKGIVRDSPFSGIIVCVGVFRYTSVSGAGESVGSYVPPRSLTKEQFAEALASGFQLVSYRRVALPKPVMKGTHYTPPTEYKAVGSPVR